VAPLLFVLARPWSLIGPLLSPARRRAVHGAARASGIAAIARFATHPLIAWLAFAGSFIVWHLPTPYQWTLQTAGAHAFAAATFFLAGLAFWHVVLSPPSLRRIGHGIALLTVVTAAVIGSLPGALMSLAPRLLFVTGTDTLALCGLTPLEDQQLAGVLMWVPMDVIFFAIAGWLFVAWMREAERTVMLRVAARTSLSFIAVALLAFVLAGCGETASGSTSGPDPRKGVALINKYGCGQCHTIPGIRLANGMVGPPLTAIGSRVYIAGVMRNSPDNMAAWIEHPQDVVPGNVMPDMGIPHDEARDIAAYLATLR
jgi:cytochrome c2